MSFNNITRGQLAKDTIVISDNDTQFTPGLLFVFVFFIYHLQKAQHCSTFNLSCVLHLTLTKILSRICTLPFPNLRRGDSSRALSVIRDSYCLLAFAHLQNGWRKAMYDKIGTAPLNSDPELTFNGFFVEVLPSMAAEN